MAAAMDDSESFKVACYTLSAIVLITFGVGAVYLTTKTNEAAANTTVGLTPTFDIYLIVICLMLSSCLSFMIRLLSLLGKASRLGGWPGLSMRVLLERGKNGGRSELYKR